MSWTKDIPKEPGFYWWRRDSEDDEPTVIKVEEDLDTVYMIGTEIPYALKDGEYSHAMEGEFWPVKLTPP